MDSFGDISILNESFLDKLDEVPGISELEWPTSALDFRQRRSLRSNTQTQSNVSLLGEEHGERTVTFSDPLCLEEQGLPLRSNSNMGGALRKERNRDDDCLDDLLGEFNSLSSRLEGAKTPSQSPADDPKLWQELMVEQKQHYEVQIRQLRKELEQVKRQAQGAPETGPIIERQRWSRVQKILANYFETYNIRI